MTTASGIGALQALGRRVLAEGQSFFAGSILWKAVCCAALLLMATTIGGSVWAIATMQDATRTAHSLAAGVPASPRDRTDTAEAAADEPATEPAALPPLALLPPPPPRPITLELSADLRAQRLKVIENGAVKFTWPISSGRSGFETKTGTFRPQWASRMWYSRQYELAPMPHAVFFHQGAAFHATNAIGMLGRPASHGCIRLAPGNAAQLYKLVHKHGFAQTKIVVHHGARHKAPPTAMKAGRKRVAKSVDRRAPKAVDRRAKSRLAARSGASAPETKSRVR